MKYTEIELTEPIVKMLAHAYRTNDRSKDIYLNFMNKYYDEIEAEGSISWYEDEYDNFFYTICDLDEELNKK